MLIDEPLPFIKDFIEKVNEEIKKHKPENVLSRLQMYWTAFCIVGIFMARQDMKEPVLGNTFI
ncbi:MAG: hypothetical protein GY795_44655 [Desulfobacterales bacterium]|nr:hypothetical protein [Desulfobacterales bacterium]